MDGRACIVMEYVAGQRLEATLDAGPLAPAQAIQIAAEIVEALELAYAAGFCTGTSNPRT